MKYVLLVDHAVRLLGMSKWPKGGQIACSNPQQELTLIFSEELTHAVVVEQLQKVYPGLAPTSAGFCELNEDGWHCEGKSVSLNLQSFPSDTKTIADAVFKSLDED